MKPPSDEQELELETFTYPYRKSAKTLHIETSSVPLRNFHLNPLYSSGAPRPSCRRRTIPDPILLRTADPLLNAARLDIKVKEVKKVLAK